MQMRKRRKRFATRQMTQRKVFTLRVHTSHFCFCLSYIGTNEDTHPCSKFFNKLNLVLISFLQDMRAPLCPLKGCQRVMKKLSQHFLYKHPNLSARGRGELSIIEMVPGRGGGKKMPETPTHAHMQYDETEDARERGELSKWYREEVAGRKCPKHPHMHTCNMMKLKKRCQVKESLYKHSH